MSLLSPAYNKLIHNAFRVTTNQKNGCHLLSPENVWMTRGDMRKNGLLSPQTH